VLAIGEGDAGGAGALAAGDRCGARGLRGAITSPRGQSPGARRPTLPAAPSARC
jgi:hypothetical protein